MVRLSPDNIKPSKESNRKWEVLIMKNKANLYKFYISAALLALAFLTTLPRFFQIFHSLAASGGTFLLLAGPGLWHFIRKMKALHQEEAILLSAQAEQITAP